MKSVLHPSMALKIEKKTFTMIRKRPTLCRSAVPQLFDIAFGPVGSCSHHRSNGPIAGIAIATLMMSWLPTATWMTLWLPITTHMTLRSDKHNTSDIVVTHCNTDGVANPPPHHRSPSPQHHPCCSHCHCNVIMLQPPAFDCSMVRERWPPFNTSVVCARVCSTSGCAPRSPTITGATSPPSQQWLHLSPSPNSSSKSEDTGDQM